jgi:hypothetical protein
VGIVASLIGFGVYVPRVGVYISLVSVVGMQVWYVMIALTLLRLSNRATQSAPQPTEVESKMAAD